MMCSQCRRYQKHLKTPKKMPLYILPDKLFEHPLTYLCDYQGKEGEGISFSLPEHDLEWSNVYAYGGIRTWNRATMSLLSPYVLGWNAPPAEQLEIKQVDLGNRFLVVQYKDRFSERNIFPPGTQAIIIDTDCSVTDHFVDNMCSYCTGLWGKRSEKAWIDRFYDEMHIERSNKEGTNVVYHSENSYYSKWTWANPFSKYARVVHQHGRLTPCLPWPTPPYLSNGRGEVSKDKCYKWPAYMSVALLFTQKLHCLQYGIISARSKKFCEHYPVETSACKYSKVTKIRQMEMDVFQFWRDWNEGERSYETMQQWNELAFNTNHFIRKPDPLPPKQLPSKQPELKLLPYDPNPSHVGRPKEKFKVKIEEITTEADKSGIA